MEKSRQARARERKLRARYRRRLRVAIVLCLIIGLAGGFVVGRLSAGAPINPLEKTVDVNAAPTPTPTPFANPLATEVPTAEPTSEVTTTVQLPTPTPTALPVATAEPQAVETIVPYGETQEVTVQAYSDGTVRKVADALPFETVSFTLNVTRYLSNDYYNETYGSTHRLVGNEAGVEFELLVNDYMGSITLDPNELLKNTGVEDASGNRTLGYRFTDKEISGEDEFTVTTNVPTLIYKRFDNTSAEMKYLTVTTYVDGVEHVYKFELGSPVVEATASPEPVSYTELKLGSSGDDVMKLQNRLIELGYLAEGSADGAYGNMTATAIMKAQKDFGMTEDGLASVEFQTKLFAEN